MSTSEVLVGSGVPGLDQILGGGYVRESICLLRGTPGTGKTTASLQFLMEGARLGEPSVYLSTSESEADIQRIASSHGWSLEGVRIHHLVAQPGDTQTVLHPAEIELPATVESILAVVDEIEPLRVVIDSLSEIRVLAREEFWYRQQLMALKRYFQGRRATVLMTDLAAENAAVNSVVNGVVELEQLAPLYGASRRRVRVTKMRGQDAISGYHDAAIRRGGLQVFPRLSPPAGEASAPLERMSTGLPELDAMLDGGLARRTSTLLLGASGAGKSLLATRLAVAAAERGEKAHIYAFDERAQTFLHRSEGAGLALGDHLASGRMALQQIDPTEMSPGEFSAVVRSAVVDDDAKMIVLDSLNGYALSMSDQRSLSVHVRELMNFLGGKDVNLVCTLTAHGVLVSHEGTDSLDLSYLSDTVLLLRLFEYKGAVRRALSVYKDRSGGHEATLRELRFTDEGPRIGEPLTRFHGVLTGVPSFMGDELGHVD